MSDWIAESENSHGEDVCGFCHYFLVSCICTGSYNEYALETESNTDLSSASILHDSYSSWQHIVSGREQQQQNQRLHSGIPEAQTGYGLTSQRLDDLQLDFSHIPYNDNVDHWERPYNPIHSQMFANSASPIQPSDGTESSSSTILPPSDHGHVDVAWNDPIGRYQHVQPASTAFRPVCSQQDFIDGHFARVIWLIGTPDAVQSLLQTVGGQIQRQLTSGYHQLCALYALEISLLAMYHNNSAAHVSVSFNSLLRIFRSEEYEQEASQQVEDIRNARFRNELSSPNNLSVNLILIILRILGRQMDEVFTLGVCTPSVRGNTDSYNVCLQPTSSDDAYANVVWLYNNKLDLDGSGSLRNHWSGFGREVLAQNNTPTPHFSFNVDYVDATAPDVETDRSTACTPSSTTDSSFYLTGSPQFSNHSSSAYTSRVSSTEPEYESLSGDKLLLRRPSIRRKTHSVSSRSSNKDQAQCDMCGKNIQKRGLSKHKKTHDREHNQQGHKYQCPQCIKRFQHPKDVKRHQSTHSLSRESKCPFLDCPYATSGFTRKDHLVRHMGTVHSYTGPPETEPDVNRFDDEPLFD